MAEQTREDLKNYFNPGDRPTSDEFADLIDSFVSRQDDAFVESLPSANTTTAGIVRRSTSTEVTNGANVNAYVTPSNTVNAINERAPGLAPVQSVNGQDGDVILSLGEDSGWLSPLLSPGLSAFGGAYQVPRYRKKNDVVYIEGLVKGGISGGTVTVFTLPLDYRPSKTLIFTIQTSGELTRRLDITSAGAVIIYNYNSSWCSLSVSFMID